MMKLPAVFHDPRGVETTQLQTDGHELEFTVRGTTFRGSSFDFLVGPGSGDFDYDRGMGTDGAEVATLINFALDVSLPLQLSTTAGVEEARLDVTADFRSADQSEPYRLVLRRPDSPVGGDTPVFRSDDFESALGLCQQALPAGVTLRCCLSCRRSHYNPFGNLGFGQLACFRDTAVLPSAIRDKTSLLHAWEEAPGCHALQYVQETHHCAEYEPAGPNDWLYKSWPPPQQGV